METLPWGGCKLLAEQRSSDQGAAEAPASATPSAKLLPGLQLFSTSGIVVACSPFPPMALSLLQRLSDSRGLSSLGPPHSASQSDLPARRRAPPTPLAASELPERPPTNPRLRSENVTLEATPTAAPRARASEGGSVGLRRLQWGMGPAGAHAGRRKPEVGPGKEAISGGAAAHDQPPGHKAALCSAHARRESVVRMLVESRGTFGSAAQAILGAVVASPELRLGALATVFRAIYLVMASHLHRPS